MKRFVTAVAAATSAAVLSGIAATSAAALDWRDDPPEFLSSGGMAAFYGPQENGGDEQSAAHDNGRGGNTYVNDPCLDPAAPNRQRTVQSETEIAVLNTAGSMGKKMVAGYNDSYGFYNNKEGLSGYAYSVNGGNTWIDGGGLPPRVPLGGPNVVIPTIPPQVPPVGQDGYFGDPVVVVHHATQTFYFSSIYKTPRGDFTLSVNKGRFAVAPPNPAGGVESISNTRCLNDPTQFGVPDAPKVDQERIVWDPPVEAPTLPFTEAGPPVSLLDKEWLGIDQKSGTLYLTYTRFKATGETPLEIVICRKCAFLQRPLTESDWTTPREVIPNELEGFNQATMPITVPLPGGGTRVIVTWLARKGLHPPLLIFENETHIESIYSDTDGETWPAANRRVVAEINPQREPPGYNRGRASILNQPYIAADWGADDGVVTVSEATRRGFGNAYITYFSGCTPLGQTTACANIYLSTSKDGGNTWGPQPVGTKVNDDVATTSHVFPSVQVNKHGYVYTSWLDRRFDPANRLTDLWASVSHNQGACFGPDRLQTDLGTDWFVRADAAPNFGDYNSSELLGFNDYVSIWADGRFPPPPDEDTFSNQETPDTIFTIANGLGTAGC